MPPTPILDVASFYMTKVEHNTYIILLSILKKFTKKYIIMIITKYNN